MPIKLGAYLCVECSTEIDFALTIEKVDRDKHSGLFRKSVSDGRKKLYDIGPGPRIARPKYPDSQLLTQKG
jgi:hypothetical protein